MREVRASGPEALSLASALLQRARLADPGGGRWEAADLQWWSRTPRRSDDVEQPFWVDDGGPVAAAVLTDWGESWTCDPLLVPGAPAPARAEVWERALETAADAGLDAFDVFVRDDDAELLRLVEGTAAAEATERSWDSWLDPDDRPPRAPLPDGFALVDRAHAERPHPMRARNGDEVEARLRRCPLYEPTLDLAVETADGDVAGYSLYWFDPVTRVGLLEPMRVEDAFARRGLARAMLAEGLDRLARRGARRLKVGFATEPARALYTGAGFEVANVVTLYRCTPR